MLELLGDHFDGETGLADEAKLGGETYRSACGAGQGEEKHLVLHSAGCRSGVKLIPEMGSPEHRPRGGGAEVTGSAHDVPPLQHDERGEVAALFSMSVRADDRFEALAAKKKSWRCDRMSAYQEALQACDPARPISVQWSSSRRACSASMAGNCA